MTDKQIIVDGVDVSGCPYYIHKDGSCSSHDCECVKCVHNVCFYKDYKVKEQECEELKIYIESNEQQVKEVETLVMDNDRLINELDKLKQTLTEIKEIAEKAKKDICNNCGWRNTDSCDADDYTCGEFIKILQKISEVEDV